MDDKPDWAAGLEPKGVYYEGIIAENLEDVLDRHRLATVTTYGTRKSRKNSDQPEKENVVVQEKPDDVENTTATCTASDKVPRLFWRKQEGVREVSFNGVPFAVEEERILDCQYGQHYFKKSKKTASTDKFPRLRLQGSRKIGCLAKITIKKFSLFPEYKISSDDTSSKRDKKRRQQESLDSLKEALSTHPNTVEKTHRYLVSLPTEAAHHRHPTGDSAGFAQKLHPAIITKISELVCAGITNITDIKRSLRLYVQQQLSQQMGGSPKSSNRALYPTDNDIRNHVYLAKKAMAFSKLDQDNLRHKIEEWRSHTPGQQIFFRPYVTLEKHSETVPETSKGNPELKTAKTSPQYETSTTSSEHETTDPQRLEPNKPGRFNGNSGSDDSSQSSSVGETPCAQRFLLVLQEEWQRKLLQRYGNTICLIDATYKTTQYDLPLFFICVKTNVGYMIVAEFIVQSEESEQLREAIEILKSWNPGWHPTYFMCDYSEAELLALEACFSGITVYLCDFHREQAWERWIKNSKHGLTKEEGDILLGLLRDCATASPCTDDSSSLDQAYQHALQRLKQSSVWKNHKAVQEWLKNNWLNIPERWARAYRDNVFHAAVDTNNGVEAQNKVLKYKYLPKRKSRTTLSSITTLLIEEFLPEMYQKYQFENFKMSEDYRTYNDFVPAFLRGRPRTVIVHCMERKQRVRGFSAEDIQDVATTSGQFHVQSSSGKQHLVDFGVDSGKPSCSCKDWIRFQIPCKHFFAVFFHRAQWQWNSLPSSYLQSAYLSQDQAVLMDTSCTELVQQSPCDDEMENLTHGGYEEVYNQQIPNKKSTSMHQVRRKVVESLKAVESLAYLVQDPEQLTQLLHDIQNLGSELRNQLPSNDGLLLRPASLSERARRVRQKYRIHRQRASRFSSLEQIAHSKRGRKRQDSRFRGRVGKKADRLRKIAAEEGRGNGSPPTQSTVCGDEGAGTPDTNPQQAAGGFLSVQPGCKGRKRKRCMECSGCVSEDCRQCSNCLDMKKYGGKGVKKQSCKKRKCTGPHYSDNAAEKAAAHLSGPVLLCESGRKIQPSMGDGNCFFRSLAFQILGDEKHHFNVRSFIVRFENFNSGVFEPRLISGKHGVNKPTLQQHIHHMMRPNTFATHVELQAAATYYQVPLYVFIDNHWEVTRPVCDHRKLRFPEIVETDPTYPLQTYQRRHFELFYHDNHYDSVVSSTTNSLHESAPDVTEFFLDSMDLTA